MMQCGAVYSSVAVCVAAHVRAIISWLLRLAAADSFFCAAGCGHQMPFLPRICGRLPAHGRVRGVSETSAELAMIWRAKRSATCTLHLPPCTVKPVLGIGTD